MISKLHLEKNMIYKNGDDTMLANLYKYATAFIYPSKYEGFGLPPLEAMHYGVPVIASHTSSIPEVVGDAGVYFDPNSVDDMKEKIDFTLNSKNIRIQLRKKGYAREKSFSWDKCANETLKFYKEVCLK